MDRSVLASLLRARGFKVVQPLKSASGHAVIFRVQETEEAEPYVAKVVSLTGLDAKGRTSAQQEVSLLKGLSAHPNLIGYRESFLEEAGMLYIVMSLAEDGDLRCVVTEAQAAKRVLPEAVVLAWMRQILAGLRHLHRQGVVHRDLKSSNIFLCEGRRRIRIGDFGISRVLESTNFASSVVGTPAYMSPELMRNERYDYHVDMWALGCICFELCTLQLPFSARSLLELACQVIESEPAWPLWDSAGFSDELLDVAQRLLRKNVAGRPSAESLLQEPLFAEGGRAARAPPEEAWASLAHREPELRTPEKRPMQPPMSQLTTAVTGNSLSSKGGWTVTPRMPWAASSSRGGSDVGTDGASSAGGAPSLAGSFVETAPISGCFARQLQQHRAISRGEPQPPLSREAFAEMLSTHHGQLLAELQRGTCAALPGPATPEAPRRHLEPLHAHGVRVVAETIV